MSAFFASLGMPEIVAGIIVLALNAYVLMGGADYGGGVWDLFATGPRREQQRELIASSIAPIWEANHVWLIVVVVMLFTGFPAAFGLFGVVFHVPLSLILIGIVMRGSAFVFRSYGSRHHTTRHRWGAIFASASLVTPIVLGMVIGAVASGAAGEAAKKVETTASFSEIYFSPWLAAFPLAVGAFALSLFAMLAAVYLTVEANSDELRNDFRARALIAAGAVFVTSAVALLLARSEAARVAAGLTTSPWSLVLHACTATAAITAILSLWTRHYRVARVAAAAQVSLILWGWAVAQYPYLAPTTLTIRAAAAPTITLRLLLIGLAGGALVLIPSLRYLFKTFAGKAAKLSA